ncbi:MAG: hypothetical protein II921_05510 [Treponema sp.]|nr:hypothetical protein [Treponema sp.]
MNYFSAEGLINLYSEEMSETDRTVTVLNDVTNAVEKNTKKIIKLNRYNRVISFGVFALVFGFAIASVLFFFSL